ncbi:MAG TPA: hypothetical protein VK625_20330 [Flavitalea sp.]|nr:hypothetical protein [Flavitalea sp.]
MKKFIVAILAILYLGTSTGATVHLHYCMDNLVGWDLWARHGDDCSNCGMTKEQKKEAKGCCKDERKQIKLTTDHKAIDDLQLIYKLQGTISPVHFELPPVYFSSISYENAMGHAPPGNAAPPIYLVNCTFRI